MAKIFRIDGYLVDPMNNGSCKEIKDIIEEGFASGFGYVPQQIHVSESNEFKSEKEMPESVPNCDMALLERHFESVESVMTRKVIPGQLYRHFKGKLVTILAVSRHTEHTNDILVTYMVHNDGTTWCRPYDQFISEVDHKKYPSAEQIYRFELMR